MNGPTQPFFVIPASVHAQIRFRPLGGSANYSQHEETVMASKQHGHRAIAVGISGGIGLAVPLLAHVATQSSPEAQATVASLSIPFALGSFAGVGAYVLSSSLFDMMDRRDAERAAEYASVAAAVQADAPAAAQGAFVQESGNVAPFAAGECAPAAVTTSFEADIERFFGRHGKPDDVPVIARAADAMSEAQAWEEIDSMLSDSSPVSCDPLQSKDIYQIALEELARSGATGVVGRASAARHAASAAAAGASADAAVATDAAAAGDASVPADATATFMAIAASREGVTESLSKDRLDEIASREAAMGSLDIMVAEEDMPAVAPVAQPAQPVTVAPQAGAAVQATSLIDFDLDEPSGFVFQPAQAGPVAVAADAADAADVAAEPVASAASSSTDNESQTVEVPMVDYSGHEEMWAEALAILEEPAAPAAPMGAHFAPRVAAVNEGRRATAVHSHVNQLLDQELNHIESQSMRHTSREFLRVIQGGTAAMPRLQAEEA